MAEPIYIYMYIMISCIILLHEVFVPTCEAQITFVVLLSILTIHSLRNWFSRFGRSATQLLQHGRHDTVWREVQQQIQQPETVCVLINMEKSTQPKQSDYNLAGDIVLCSWAGHFTLTAPLSTQVYK